MSVELTFSESVNQSCVRIPIQNDNRVEGQEEFTVTLNSTDTDVIVGPPSTVTIVDDDGEDNHMICSSERMDAQFTKYNFFYDLQESLLVLRMKPTHQMRDKAQ